MQNKKNIEDVDVSGKKVIVRVDFNVPLDINREILNDRRIVEALPTIKYLIKRDAKIILISHLEVHKDGSVEQCSNKLVAKRLSELLEQEVIIASDIIGKDAKKKADDLKPGQVLMLENVRFHYEETSKDLNVMKTFARDIASLADIYVNDAFATAHRIHASVVSVALFLPSVCGYLIKNEIEILENALSNPRRPYVAILGGSKVSDKISVIKNLIDKVDALLIGGRMAYTFFKAKGYRVGDTVIEEDKIELAGDLIKKAEKNGAKLILPVDCVVAREFSVNTEKKVVKSNEIEDGWIGLDIGNETIRLFSSVVKNANTVIWNGPLGVFEMPDYSTGTNEIIKAMSESDALTIMGGGDSAAAVEQTGLADKISYISTGGGAFLKFLSGEILPGIDVLLNR